jgi:hypothetical protein
MWQANSLPILPDMINYLEGQPIACNSEEVVQLCVQMVCKLPNAYFILLILLAIQVVWQLGKAPGTHSSFAYIYFHVSFGDIRFVLAATEHLHRCISKLSGRIRQLEDALAALHAKHLTEVHPLLHEDLMQTDERDEADTPADETWVRLPRREMLLMLLVHYLYPSTEYRAQDIEVFWPSRDFITSTDGLQWFGRLTGLPCLPYDFANSVASDSMVQVLRTMTEVATSETLLHLTEIVKESLDETKFFWESIQEPSKLLPFIDLPGGLPNSLRACGTDHSSVLASESAMANQRFRSLVASSDQPWYPSSSKYVGEYCSQRRTKLERHRSSSQSKFYATRGIS